MLGFTLTPDELIHGRLLALVSTPPPYADDDLLNEWARRHNADWHAHQQRLEQENRDKWAALGSEYVGA